MTARDCILGKAAEGLVDPRKAEDAARRFDEAVQEIRQRGRTRSDAERMAAVRIHKEMVRKFTRQKRMRLKQAQAGLRIRERAAALPGQVDIAMASLLDIDPQFRAKGDNVAILTESIRGLAHGRMADFLEKVRPRAAGLIHPRAGVDNIVKELFNEGTGDVSAREIAQGVEAAFDLLRGRFNAAGGDIIQRKSWGLPQGHNRGAIAAATKSDWIEFTSARIDRAKMRGDDGEAISLRELLSALDEMYDDLATGGLATIVPIADAARNSVTKRTFHRFLVFRDADAWLEYQARFGSPDPVATIMHHVDGLSRDIAAMEVLGPFPHRALEMMEGMVDSARARGAISGTGKAAAKLADKIGGNSHLRNLFNTVVGRLDRPSNSVVAALSQGNRSLVTAAALGGAFLSSIGDVVTAQVTAQMVGIPYARILARQLKLMLPGSAADKKALIRAGYTAQGWADRALAARRVMGEIAGPEWTDRITDTVLRASLLSPWTEAGRWSFMAEFSGFLADNAGKALGDLPGALRATLERHGLTARQWDLIRKTPVWRDTDTGATFLRAEDIARHRDITDASTTQFSERFEAANAMQRMIASETRFAVVESTPSVRAAMTGGTASGSFWGEVIRNVTLFKTFPVSFMHQHMSRAVALGGTKGSFYLAHLFLGLTTMGVLVDQASEITKGRDPQPLSDPRVWAKGAARGGGLGLIGDFLFSDVSRYGHSLSTSLAGPVASELDDVTKLTLGNIQRALRGDKTKVGADIARFVRLWTPGRSVWYTRLATERLIMDEMQRMMDPDAAAKFTRVERRAQRRFGQKFFAPPGGGIERLPDLGAALR